MGGELKVRDLMIHSTEPLNSLQPYIDSDSPAEDAYPLFLKYSVESLAVKEEERMIGQISLNDVLGLHVPKHDKSKTEASLREPVRQAL